MASSLILCVAVFAPIITIASIFIGYRHVVGMKINPSNSLDLDALPEETKRLRQRLVDSLPHCVILEGTRDRKKFKEAIAYYWAQQEREVSPTCIVQPRTVQDLSTAVNILSQEYQERTKKSSSVNNKANTGGGKLGLFAVRSGGHSPISGAASIPGGVLVDMKFFSEVVPLEDGSGGVSIGTGARWGQVAKILEKKGLAVSGGRDGDVGVGGYLLGGGLSYFSGSSGLSCSNIISYEIVLANGTVVNASATNHPDLWRALKGGLNNFGIVTRFIVRSFPSSDIWAGFLFLPSTHAKTVLTEFHNFVNRSESSTEHKYDPCAAGPLAGFGYLHSVRMQLVSVHLVYTKVPENPKKWPACWDSTGLKSLWRFWSTIKVRSLSSMTEEMTMFNAPGIRQTWATTTIKNDFPTMTAAHTIYLNAMKEIRQLDIKGMKLTVVFQPLLPAWVHKGDPNPQGLHDLREDEPHVIIIVCALWSLSRDDVDSERIVRKVVTGIEDYSKTHDTSHPWKYLNYCGGWQQPFKGFGMENLRFLKQVSRAYDPDGLFQRGCTGGFKLGMEDGDMEGLN